MKRNQIIFLILLAIVFIVFAFFRFYNLPMRIIFDWDQEQFTTQVRDIIANHKFTLIGPRVVGPEGFFLAPYLTYLIIPFFLFTKLHPIALLYFIVVFDCLFFAVSFFILAKLFSKWYALAFLAFWSSAPLFINYDIIPWWPLLIPLGVLLTLFLLYKVYFNKNLLYWILLGLNLGFFMNMHFQFIFIIIWSLIFILISSKKKLLLKPKNLLGAFAAFLLMFLPLVLFDLRHNFLNIKLLLTFFIPKHGSNFDPTSWTIVLTNALQPFIFFRSVPLGIGLYILFFLMIRYLSQKKEGFYKYFYQATTVLWIIVPIFFTIYGKRPSEYYFNFLYPFILVGIIDYFLVRNKPALLTGIIILFIVINAPFLHYQLATNPYGLGFKDQVIKKIKQKTSGLNFNIALDTGPNGDTGFRYLIDYYKIKQSGNSKDQQIIIRTQPHDDGDQRIGGYGLLLPPNLRD